MEYSKVNTSSLESTRSSSEWRNVHRTSFLAMSAVDRHVWSTLSDGSWWRRCWRSPSIRRRGRRAAAPLSRSTCSGWLRVRSCLDSSTHLRPWELSPTRCRWTQTSPIREYFVLRSDTRLRNASFFYMLHRSRLAYAMCHIKPGLLALFLNNF